MQQTTTGSLTSNRIGLVATERTKAWIVDPDDTVIELAPLVLGSGALLLVRSPEHHCGGRDRQAPRRPLPARDRTWIRIHTRRILSWGIESDSFAPPATRRRHP